jgi:hypothetical protein
MTQMMLLGLFRPADGGFPLVCSICQPVEFAPEAKFAQSLGRNVNIIAVYNPRSIMLLV